MVKRMFSVLLACVLLFNVVSRPAYAVEIADDEFENATAIYPYSTDENGYITSDEMNLPQTVVVGESIVLGGWGALGSVAGGVFLVILLLKVAGVAFDSLLGMIQEGQRIYNKLSEDSQQYLDSCYEAGTESFLITQALAEDFLAAYGEVYAEDDGTLKTEGFTFSVSSLLQYDYNTQRVYDDELTSPIYTIPLSTTAQAIPGTTLTIKKTYYFNDISGRSNPYAFYITNTSTGVSATFVPFGINDEKECASVSLSVPVIQAYQSNSSNFVYHIIGFWSMETCSIRDTGTGLLTCPLHSAKYSSEFLSDSSRTPAAITFENTGTEIDGKLINAWYFRTADSVNYDTDCIEWYFEDDETSSYISDKTPLAYLMSAPAYTIAHTGDAEEYITAGTTVYQPTTDVSTSVNTVTRAEVLTGVASVPDTDVSTNTGVDTSSWWATLLAWLAAFWDNFTSALTNAFSTVNAWVRTFWTSMTTTLTDVFADVISWVQSFWTTLTTTLTDVLTAAFVPSADFLAAELTVYEEKFGWFTDLFGFFGDLFDNLSCNEPPKIPIYLSAAESKYDWGSDGYILDMTWYARYKPSVDTVLSGLLWAFFLWRLFKRLPDIFSGMGLQEENAQTSAEPTPWLMRPELPSNGPKEKGK